MTNAEFAKVDQAFIQGCVEASVEQTARQASKFRRGFGAAYNAMKKRPVASRVDQKVRLEALYNDRFQGRRLGQFYGPYAADRKAANTAPKKKS